MKEFKKAWLELEDAIQEFGDAIIKYFKIDKILNWLEKKLGG